MIRYESHGDLPDQITPIVSSHALTDRNRNRNRYEDPEENERTAPYQVTETEEEQMIAQHLAADEPSTDLKQL